MPISLPTNLQASGSVNALSEYAASTPELDLLAAQHQINNGEHLSDQQIQELLDKIGDNPALRDELLRYAASRPSQQVAAVTQRPTDGVEWSPAPSALPFAGDE
jgi:hypothetical protein